MKQENLNCWDFMNCSEEDKCLCSAYKNNMGKECWLVAGSISSHPDCVKVRKQIFSCWECPWYKKVNGEKKESQ